MQNDEGNATQQNELNSAGSQKEPKMYNQPVTTADDVSSEMLHT